jgi:hypothetical protein
MKRTNWSNPNGLGFSEMLLCPESVFTLVYREIEAGNFSQARALLQLHACEATSTAARQSEKGHSR